jgi:hypothetical protein
VLWTPKFVHVARHPKGLLWLQGNLPPVQLQTDPVVAALKELMDSIAEDHYRQATGQPLQFDSGETSGNSSDVSSSSSSNNTAPNDSQTG